MIYNKYCENIVLVSYPSYSGGKFIINNLGLSKHCFFQKSDLVKKQLSNEFNPSQKLSYLLDQLSKQIPYQWNDLELGCWQLFDGDPSKPEKFTEEIIKLTHYDLGLFFKAIDSLENLNVYQTVWPRSKHIHITNTTKFMNWRLNLPEDFNRTKYPNLSQDFPLELDRQLSNDAIIWNCDWFFDWDTFCAEMQNLYNKFQLPDFDVDLIKQYYHAYYDTLLRIRHV